MRLSMIILAIFISIPLPRVSHAVSNGITVDEKTLPAVVAMTIRLKSTKAISLCTAAFIGPKTLITAAHCFPSAVPTKTLLVSDFEVNVSNKTAFLDETQHFAMAGALFVHPQYIGREREVGSYVQKGGDNLEAIVRNSTNSYDVALLVLPAPKTIGGGYLNNIGSSTCNRGDLLDAGIWRQKRKPGLQEKIWKRTVWPNGTVTCHHLSSIRGGPRSLFKRRQAHD